MEIEEPLELDVRRRIYNYIAEFPGVHLREIKRSLGISSMGNLEYHLNYLENRGLIVSGRNGQYKRYYVTRPRVMAKKLLSILRQKIPRQIVIYLLLNPESSHREVHSQFNIAQSTFSFHMKKLVEKGVVSRRREGREVFYSVVNRDEVADVLITYRATFLDKVVDNFAELWG